METTKTEFEELIRQGQFYRSQFWRLQKPLSLAVFSSMRFIGHNFGDYKNPAAFKAIVDASFIGHNFGDYKNAEGQRFDPVNVLSVTILETTKTSYNTLAFVKSVLSVTILETTKTSNGIS